MAFRSQILKISQFIPISLNFKQLFILDNDNCLRGNVLFIPNFTPTKSFQIFYVLKAIFSVRLLIS